LSEYLSKIDSLIELIKLSETNLLLSSTYTKEIFPFINSNLSKYQQLYSKVLDDTDDRIKGRLSKEEIENYFMQFNQKQKDNNLALTNEQIKQLLHANFKDFKPRIPIRKLDTPNITKSELIEFVRVLHRRHNRSNRTGQYVALLKENFSIFDDTTLVSLKSNFSR
jgi:hypothetical protein